MAKKRKKMNQKESERYFTNTAKDSHPKNLVNKTSAGPMRGGTRL